MHKINRYLKWSIAVVLLLQACAGSKVNENDPASLMADANEEIENSHYLIAIEKLKNIKNKFPYSKYGIDSQLRIADVYFLQGSYAEAAAAYENFRDLHPRHEKIPYVYFRIGFSYYKDSPSNSSRDLSSAARANDALSDYFRKYPEDNNRTEAQEAYKSTRELLAEKELMIGDFYYRRDVSDAAKARYTKLINMYPDTDAAGKAKEKLDKLTANISGDSTQEGSRR